MTQRPTTLAVTDGVNLDAVATAVRGCPGVDALDAGPVTSRVTTYLPGRKLDGLKVTADTLTVQVRGIWDVPATEVAHQVRAAASALVEGRAIDVVISDLAPAPGYEPEPAPQPERKPEPQPGAVQAAGPGSAVPVTALEPAAATPTPVAAEALPAMSTPDPAVRVVPAAPPLSSSSIVVELPEPPISAPGAEPPVLLERTVTITDKYLLEATLGTDPHPAQEGTTWVSTTPSSSAAASDATTSALTIPTSGETPPSS